MDGVIGFNNNNNNNNNNNREQVQREARVVQTLDSAIHRINHYPADSVIDFRNTYWLDSDLSGGYRYPTFEQPGPDHRALRQVMVGRSGYICNNYSSHCWIAGMCIEQTR